MNEEYQRYGQIWKRIDSRSIVNEDEEYEKADLNSVPSQFCFDSFTAQGIPVAKLIKVPYCARLERF